MSVLEFLRGYTLREYAVVFSMAVLGGLGLVFMLSSMGGGAAGAGEDLVKREVVRNESTASLRYVEENAAARARTEARARAVAARRARLLAAREIAAARAARRARAASRNAPTRRTVVRTAPRVVSTPPTPVVNRTPSRPAPAPKPAPAPRPTPQKSGTSGGGGGSFDDSG